MSFFQNKLAHNPSKRTRNESPFYRSSCVKLLLLCLWLLPTFSAVGQTGMPTPPARHYTYESSLGIVGGLHQGRHTFGEIGIGYGCLQDLHGYYFWGITGTVEANPWNNVYALNISLWKSLPMIPISVGFSSVSFFQYGVYDQALRPSIGIAYRYLHLTYSYDFTIGNRSIDFRNRHMVSLRYFLPTVYFKKTSWELESYGSKKP